MSNYKLVCSDHTGPVFTRFYSTLAELENDLRSELQEDAEIRQHFNYQASVSEWRQISVSVSVKRTI